METALKLMEKLTVFNNIVGYWENICEVLYLIVCIKMNVITYLVIICKEIKREQLSLKFGKGTQYINFVPRCQAKINKM